MCWRISIARAMMKDAPIILDEATANVDPEDEKELMEAIGALTHEKTVRHADQILVVGCGTHRPAGHPWGADGPGRRLSPAHYGTGTGCALEAVRNEKAPLCWPR